MGADLFHVCYGIRQEVNEDNAETLNALEGRRHPWQILSRQHGLECWWGIGIGGSLAAPPLPHHRTYGSVSGGSVG